MIRKFISYYRPHRKLFAIDMLCSFAVAVCDLIYPVFTRQIINDYVPNRNLRMVLVMCGTLFVIYAVKAVLNYIVQYWGHIVGVRIQGDMRTEMFNKLESLPFKYFDKNKTGAIMSRMINDLMEVSELAHHGPENLFISVIMLIGSFIMLSTIDLTLTAITFGILPFIIFFAFKTRKNMNDAFKRTREETAAINAGVESAISGIRVSRSFGAAQHEKEKFALANTRFMAARARAYKVMGVFLSGMGFMSDFLYLAVLLSGGLFYYFGRIDIGDFAAFLLYVAMFLKPVRSLVDLFEQLQSGMTGFERFCEVMAQSPEKESEQPVPLTNPHGDIVFENVSFAYNTDDAEKQVLHNLCLTVPSGKTVALVGSSGGGKTTLCHLIPRFYELNGGRILIGGVDIRDVSLADLRKAVGIVTQDVFLFDGTVRENIAYGNFDADESEIKLAARRACIDEFISTLEQGYETGVGERGVRLSGGQKQRIAIARAFLKNPPILILDEATSALDNVTERELQKSLAELSEGRTCIVVAHRLSTVRNADEIIVLNKTGIAERGTHEQLLALGGEYARLCSISSEFA